MRILGLHTMGHDAGLALFENGRLIYAMEAERETRRKHEPHVDAAIDAMSRDTGLTVGDIDLVAVSTNVRTGVANVRDLEIGMARMLAGDLAFETTAIVRGVGKPCLVVAHEASHAALAAHGLPRGCEALVLVNEGRGSFCRNSLYRLFGDRLSLAKRDLLPWYGTGFGWSALAALAGFGEGPGTAGTVMALAGFAAPLSDIANALRDVPDVVMGASRAEQLHVGAQLSMRIGGVKSFDAKARLFATLQHLFTDAVTERLGIEMARAGVAHLALGGGCALNIHTNTAVRETLAADVAIPPACNDAGQALGAAIYAIRFHRGERADPLPIAGNGMTEQPTADAVPGRRGEPVDPHAVAERLARGEIVAWVEGPAEVGPRALGYRSLLASASRTGMKRRLSEEVKGRQAFRPLAPIVRRETFERLMPNAGHSPHMLFAYNATALAAPEATHADGTARIQTLSAEAQPRLWAVLEAYERLTGEAALINTSLNGKGLPIAQRLSHVCDDLRGTEVRTIVANGVMLSDASLAVRG